jgi:hypothetical protein
MSTNLPTFGVEAASVTARNAEYSGTPFTDIPGTGAYDTYLGMNAAGGNNAAIGVNTGELFQTAAELAAGKRYDSWTQLDQDNAARTPQVTQVIGGSGFVNRSSTLWPSSGGVEGKGTLPTTFFIVPGSVPGTMNLNDTANFVVADVADTAPFGGEVDTVTGTLNNTGAAVAIGDLLWGQVIVI